MAHNSTKTGAELDAAITAITGLTPGTAEASQVLQVDSDIRLGSLDGLGIGRAAHADFSIITRNKKVRFENLDSGTQFLDIVAGYESNSRIVFKEYDSGHSSSATIWNIGHNSSTGHFNFYDVKNGASIGNNSNPLRIWCATDQPTTGTMNIVSETTGEPHVGIGTSSPSEKLHVVGNVRVNGNLNLTGNNRILYFAGRQGVHASATTTKLHFGGHTDFTSFEYGNVDAVDHTVKIADNGKMRVLAQSGGVSKFLIEGGATGDNQRLSFKGGGSMWNIIRTGDGTYDPLIISEEDGLGAKTRFTFDAMGTSNDKYYVHYKQSGQFRTGFKEQLQSNLTNANGAPVGSATLYDRMKNYKVGSTTDTWAEAELLTGTGVGATASLKLTSYGTSDETNPDGSSKHYPGARIYLNAPGHNGLTDNNPLNSIQIMCNMNSSSVKFQLSFQRRHMRDHGDTAIEDNKYLGDILSYNDFDGWRMRVCADKTLAESTGNTLTPIAVESETGNIGFGNHPGYPFDIYQKNVHLRSSDFRIHNGNTRYDERIFNVDVHDDGGTLVIGDVDDGSKKILSVDGATIIKLIPVWGAHSEGTLTLRGLHNSDRVGNGTRVLLWNYSGEDLILDTSATGVSSENHIVGGVNKVLPNQRYIWFTLLGSRWRMEEFSLADA